MSETETKVQASGISLGQLSEYFGRPAGAVAGEVKNFQMDCRGTLDEPQSWRGTIVAQIDNVRQNGIALDQVGINIAAENGTATVREARIDRGRNHLRLEGTVQLPKTTEGFRRTPGDLRLTIDAPNLQELTAFLPTPLTGSLQAIGTIKTENSIAHLELTARGDLIGFGKLAVKTLNAKISATKKLPATDATKEPFYANLTSSIHAELNDVRYDQFVVDNVRAEIKSKEATVSLEPVTLQRNNDLLFVRGNYQLPPPGSTEFRLTRQPADLQFSFRAPQLSDYWQSDAPNKVTGEFRPTARCAFARVRRAGRSIFMDEKLRPRDFSLGK